jgi:hypothetical protein
VMWPGRRRDDGLRWQVEGFSLIAANRKQVPRRHPRKARLGFGMMTVSRFYRGTVAGIKKRGRASKGCGKIDWELRARHWAD